MRSNVTTKLHPDFDKAEIETMPQRGIDIDNQP